MKIKRIIGLLGFGALCLTPLMANAIELQAVLGRFQGQLTSVADMISGAAYIGGAGLGVLSLFKLKEYSDNSQQNKLSKPLILMMVSAGLLSLPSFLTVGGDSTGLDTATGLTTWTSPR